MTPQQKQALEALAGRSLTAEQIAEIDQHLPTRRDDLIAQVLGDGPPRVVKTLGGIGMVLEALGPVDGAAVLDQLEALTGTVPAVKWAFVLVNRGELDFGSAATRAMIDQLLPGPVGASLKAIAEVRAPIAVGQVSDALNVAEGRLTLGSF